MTPKFSFFIKTTPRNVYVEYEELCAMASNDFWDTFNFTPTQLERYTAQRSPEWILNFIRRGSGKGTAGEAFFEKKFNIVQPRHPGESGHDKTVLGKRIEHKVSALWNSKTPFFKWQHIEVLHNWDLLVFMGIDFHSVVWYAMTRADFDRMRNDLGAKVIQGKVSGDTAISIEGHWCTLTQALPYITNIGSTDNSDITDLVDESSLRSVVSSL